jgi:hypothetical protein
MKRTFVPALWSIPASSLWSVCWSDHPIGVFRTRLPNPLSARSIVGSTTAENLAASTTTKTLAAISPAQTSASCFQRAAYQQVLVGSAVQSRRENYYYRQRKTELLVLAFTPLRQKDSNDADALLKEFKTQLAFKHHPPARETTASAW